MTHLRCAYPHFPLVERIDGFSQAAPVCFSCSLDEFVDQERSLFLDDYEASLEEEKVFRATGYPAQRTWTDEPLPHQLSLWG